MTDTIRLLLIRLLLWLLGQYGRSQGREVREGSVFVAVVVPVQVDELVLDREFELDRDVLDRDAANGREMGPGPIPVHVEICHDPVEELEGDRGSAAVAQCAHVRIRV